MDWFRWYHGACQHPKLHRASRAAKVSRGLVIAAWAALLEHASQADNRGDVTAMTAGDLAYLIDVKPSTAGRILDAMSDVGLIDAGRVHGWDERQRKSDDSGGRKQAQRERENAECVHETVQNGLRKPFHGRGLSDNSLETNETTPQCHGTKPPREEQIREEQKEKKDLPTEDGKKVPATAIALAQPIDAAIAAWNGMADRAGLSRCQKLTDGRKAKLLARLKDAGGLEGWYVAMGAIEESAFLTGKTTDWKANIDFALRESSFVKIMEGAYACKTPTTRGRSMSEQAREMLRGVKV